MLRLSILCYYCLISTIHTAIQYSQLKQYCVFVCFDAVIRRRMTRKDETFWDTAIVMNDETSDPISNPDPSLLDVTRNDSSIPSVFHSLLHNISVTGKSMEMLSGLGKLNPPASGQFMLNNNNTLIATFACITTSTAATTSTMTKAAITTTPTTATTTATTIQHQQQQRQQQ